MVASLVVLVGVVILIVKGIQDGRKEKKQRAVSEMKADSEMKMNSEAQTNSETQMNPEKQMNSGARPDSGSRNFLNTAALIVGVSFVILSGCIFATTTWRFWSGPAKVLSVFVLSCLAFLASWTAGKKIHIGKTAAACHILGSALLFLTVTAAGYFEMLGPVFCLEEEGWWCVLGMGAILFTIAMGIGIPWFQNNGYNWIFKIFALVSAAFLFKRIGWHTMEKLMDAYSPNLWISGFSLFALGFLVLAGGYGFFRYGSRCAEAAAMMGVAELVHFGIFSIDVRQEIRLFFVLVVMAACFFLSRQLVWNAEKHAGTFVMKPEEGIWNPSGAGIYTIVFTADILMLAVAVLFSRETVMANGMMLVAMVLAGVIFNAWGKRILVLRGFFPFLMWYSVCPAFFLLQEIWPGEVEGTAVCFGYVLGLLIWDIVKKDSFAGGIMAIGACMLYSLDSGLSETASPLFWEAAWGMAMGVCGCQMVWREKYERAVIAIVILGLHAFFAESLANTLVLEGTYLGAFFLAQRVKNERWTKGMGIMMLLTAVYMMRSLWTAIAWWVYLLLVGIGLILFAAVREKKNS